ncbi:MAG TPA: HEAT repeat domain-containing protein, partial [Acidimicrobiales bacterium]|nr:HEAT repeat domain-containing protein [Acidimicrobiales bacterium]
MISVERLRELAQEASSPRPGPTGVAAADVVPHLDSDDRNIRVAALRVLAWSDGTDDAVRGLLKALDDPKRRVRNVAAKSCVRFLDDPRIVARLVRAIEEDDRAAAQPALEVLAGAGAHTVGLEGSGPV